MDDEALDRISVDDAQIAFMYGEGMSLRDIASALRVGKTTIAQSLKRSGIGRRGKKESQATIQARMKTGRTDPQTEEKIVELYRGGASVRQISDQLGVAVTTILKVLDRHGVERRPSGAQARITPEIEQQMIDMYRSNMTIKEIGEALGFSDMAVHRVLVRYGIPRRPRAPLFGAEERVGLPRGFAVAPDDTPEWLRVHPSDAARGEKRNYVEIDVAIGDEVPESLRAKGWGKIPQQMWDLLLAKLESKQLACAMYEAIVQDDADHHGNLAHWESKALGHIGVLYEGSAVWWVDLDDGPQHAVTLFDLVVGTRQPAHDDQGHTKLWMMSLDQFDNARWPPESEGGPPYTPHVSIARAAEDRTEQGWPPEGVDEHGGLHTLVEMPKGPPRWLEAPTTAAQSHLVGGRAVAVRLDTTEWGRIFQADGYAAAHPITGVDRTPENAVRRQAKWLLEVLEGGRRTESEGSLAPNAVYIDAAHFFEPRVRFLKYGGSRTSMAKHGIWAGMGLYKKETIRELLQAMIVTHEGSTVWLYDLEAGKADRVLTLWELIGNWFGDVDGKRVAARRLHAGFGPVSIYFLEGEKKLWPMSERQWAEGEWPSPDVGGPPAAPYGMEMPTRENPIAAEDSDAALVCLGRDIILQVGECDYIELPRRWGMLRDESGTFWPKCSLLFSEFSQGKEEDDSAIGRNYFGRNADVRCGSVSMPPHDLKHGWREVGFVEEVFYRRAGTKAPGKFHHKFNDPRGWMWLVALFKRRVAETPPVLFEYDRDGVVALRLELPDGCIIHEGGIALP